MHQALEDLHVYVIYPGPREIPLTDRITAIGLDKWIQHQNHKGVAN